MVSAQTYANLGYPGEAEGSEIAVTADIARHHRNRKGKSSPTDDTGQTNGWDITGMQSCKRFRILDNGARIYLPHQRQGSTIFLP